MKKIKIPSRKLLLAIARYYMNRNAASGNITKTSIKYEGGKETICYEQRKGVIWDKQVDLQYISSCTPKGWGYEAIAGTFWIHIPHKSYKTKRYTVKVDEDNWAEFVY